MKKVLLCLGVVLNFLLMSTISVQAGELDILLDKLVDKGYLTPVEATIIKDETKQQVSSELTAGKSYAAPSWTQKVKLKGDLRLRYQGEKKESGDHVRNRSRIRYRLGVISDVANDLEVGAGIASGSSDPRSTNQTIQDTFSSKSINLDYAYAKWQALKSTSLIAGKFARKDYLWAPTDLLWDGDINPEGASVHWEGPLVSGYGGGLSGTEVDGFFNTGVWLLDENGAVRETDPFMHYYQAGIKAGGESVDAKLAATYYAFNGVRGIALDNDANTNTSTGGVLMYDYDSVGTSFEVGLNQPEESSFPIKRAAIFGDYIKNVSSGSIDKDTGWALGAKIGDKKVSKTKQWQLKYLYARLEADAFPDAFPDSDRFGGATDVKGHEIALEYALRDNIILGLDYYNSERLDNSTDEEQLGQVDLVFKF